MIAVFWSYDGWYGVTNVAGEMRDPGRNLPRSLLAGTVVVIVLYLVTNLVYFRALPVAAMQETPRIGESAAAALFGPLGARLVSAAVVVSIFGCLSATILWAARIYLPMAEDRVFFRSLAHIHPRYRTPDQQHRGPGRLGHRADLLRHVQPAHHLRDRRGLPVPRRHRRRGDGPAADTAGRARGPTASGATPSCPSWSWSAPSRSWPTRWSRSRSNRASASRSSPWASRRTCGGGARRPSEALAGRGARGRLGRRCGGRRPHRLHRRGRPPAAGARGGLPFPPAARELRGPPSRAHEDAPRRGDGGRAPGGGIRRRPLSRVRPGDRGRHLRRAALQRAGGAGRDGHAGAAEARPPGQPRGPHPRGPGELRAHAGPALARVRAERRRGGRGRVREPRPARGLRGPDAARHRRQGEGRPRPLVQGLPRRQEPGGGEARRAGPRHLLRSVRGRLRPGRHVPQGALGAREPLPARGQRLRLHRPRRPADARLALHLRARGGSSRPTPRSCRRSRPCPCRSRTRA